MVTISMRSAVTDDSNNIAQIHILSCFVPPTQLTSFFARRTRCTVKIKYMFTHLSQSVSSALRDELCGKMICGWQAFLTGSSLPCPVGRGNRAGGYSEVAGWWLQAYNNRMHATSATVGEKSEESEQSALMELQAWSFKMNEMLEM